MLGLKQAEMAKIGGVSLNTQNRYEGGTPPPIDYLLRIGQAGADWYWIVTGNRIDTEPLDEVSAEIVNLLRQLPSELALVMLNHVRQLVDVLACSPGAS